MKTTMHPYSLTTIALALLASLPVSAAISLVGVYDATTNANVVDAVSTGSDLTLQETKDRSASAFANNTGGVWDFDTAVAGEWNNSQRDAFNLQYGTSILTITLRNAADTQPLSWNQAPEVSPTVPISGGFFAGQNSGAPYLLKFNTPITMFAITQLVQLNSSRTSSITATYETGPSRSTTLVNSTTDTLHVLTGTTANRITSITLNNSNFIRWDDLAFDTAGSGVPEPSAALLGSLGVLLLLRRRR